MPATNHALIDWRTALEMARVAVETGTEAGRSVAVVVLDAGASELAVVRHEDAYMTTKSIAHGKAFTALNFRTATHEMAERLGSIDYAMQISMADTRLVFIKGGVPLVKDGRIVGSIGVSGASADEDLDLATTAAVHPGGSTSEWPPGRPDQPDEAPLPYTRQRNMPSHPTAAGELMTLSVAELEAAVRAHIDAEEKADMEALRATLHDDVEYRLMTPRYPDDPTPHGRFEGADTYIRMWEELHTIFSSYDIVLEKLCADPDAQAVWLTIRATAVPRKPWRGFAAGKPMTWRSAAICYFDEHGEMLAEDVFGSMPPTLNGVARMHEFANESA